MVYEGAPAEVEKISPAAPPPEIDLIYIDDPEIIDKPQDECGVFAIYAPGRAVGAIAFEAGRVQAHRGHSATGIVYDHPFENRMIVKKGFGKPDIALPSMAPHNGLTPAEVVGATMAAIHNRYSTDRGASLQDSMRATHPFDKNGLTLMYNGEFPDLIPLARKYGVDPTKSVSNSELCAEILSIELIQSADTVKTLATIFSQIKGAFNVVMTYRGQLITLRDPSGVHPLSVGFYADGKSGCVASETVAFDESIVGKLETVRDVRPGEAILMGPDGVQSVQLLQPQAPQLCLLESIYTAKEESVIFGTNVREGRVNMGRRLGRTEQLSSGIVIPVPQSGIPGAEGYAEATGLPLVQAVLKSSKVDRTFILEGEAQVQALAEKFLYTFDPASPYYDPNIAAQLEGQDLYVFDDSMVRGNSNGRLITNLKAAKPRSIHIRLAGPPIKGLCNLGTDISDMAELIAAGRDEREIAQILGVDSVKYNSFNDCEGAIDDARLTSSTPSLIGKFCRGCTMGEYLISQPVSRPKGDRLVFLGTTVLAAAS